MTEGKADMGSGRAGSGWRRLPLVLPFLLFAALAAVFLGILFSGRDPASLPSTLIGKPAPDFSLPALEGYGTAGLSRGDILGKPTLVNIFASWCGPCREEHPILTELARNPDIRVVGINFKDRGEDARRFLQELGNPYAAIGVDAAGRTAIDWGTYGVPETFVVTADGTIRARIAGALTPGKVRDIILPALAAKPAG